MFCLTNFVKDCIINYTFTGFSTGSITEKFLSEMTTTITENIPSEAQECEPLPGRLPKHNDFRVMLLPSDVTKRKVYDEYVVAPQEIQDAQEVQVHIFGYREFCRLWSETVPYISVMLPSSDLCFKCHHNTSAIMCSSNLPKEEKSQKLKDAEAHLAHANAECHYYHKQVKESRII